MPKISLSHMDTCLPTYFNGCDLPYVQVAVDGSTTIGDVIRGMKDEIRSGMVSNETESFTQLTEEELNKAVDALFEGKKPNSLFDASLDIPDEDEMSETAYAYFRFDCEE